MLDFRKNKDQGKKKPTGQGSPGPGSANPTPPEVRRKILVVGKGITFTPAVVDYAANLAQRLGYDIIALSVPASLEATRRFFPPYSQHVRAKFSQRARAAWEKVAAELRAQEITGEHLVKFTTVAQAVNDLNHAIKRIDFVITDAGVRDEEITGEIPLPVFSITGYQGEMVMASEHPEVGKKKLAMKTLAYGICTAVFYAAVFINGDTVMKYFTRGGWYAALPIATVFVFSFAHGAFAHNLWSVLGIEATKKVQPRVAPTRPAPRKRPRPRLYLNT